MRFYYRRTYEERSDGWPLHIGYTLVDVNRDSEVELFVIFWLAVIVYPIIRLYYFLKRWRRWFRRRYNEPPPGLQARFLAQAISSQTDITDAQLEAIKSFIRNLPPE